MKFSFYNDYSEGAHPRILEMLQSTNLVQDKGYGEDAFCAQAREAIQKNAQSPNADVHFVSGGTQANLIAMGLMLRPYEAVVACDTGHIAVHEAGAIEATGHKIITVPHVEGKMTIGALEAAIKAHTDEHMVKPRVVFISDATEIGTSYSKRELSELSDFCKKNELYLYLDGARLGSALCAGDSDVTLADIAKYTDMFYIGGTKNGALLGEAMVITNDELKKNFRFHLKQRGALLAKGRLLGIQFLALFKDNLYFELARHANKMGAMLTHGITELGYSFLANSTTNQIFPILPNTIIEKLSHDYGFYVWSKIDGQKSAVRLVTSWATPQKEVENFLSELRKLST